MSQGSYIIYCNQYSVLHNPPFFAGSELSIGHRVSRHVNAAKIRSARSIDPTVADVEKRDAAPGGHYRSSKVLSGGAKFKPFFDVSIVDDKTGLGNRNVTTVEGGRATLACTVKNLGPNRTVSEKST